MTTKAESALAVFESRIGADDEVSDWFSVDQARIDAFAEATLDRQFIHVDPERAAATPFGTTIAHGFLTLSLVSYFGAELNAADADALEGMVMGINYGLDKVRFPAPVAVGSRIRLRRAVDSVKLLPPDQVHVKHRCTVEVEGQEKPGCVAETLSRFVYE